MKFFALSGAAVVMLALAGCSGSPSAPTPTSKPVASPPVAPSPAPTGQARTFGAPAPLSYPLASYTVASRYLLYDNGTFELSYPTGSYRGTYQEAAGTMTFRFDAYDPPGGSGATGTLANDRLVVHYNLSMQLSDFEDAVYTRIQ